MNHYVVDCNKLRRNDRARSEVDVTVYLESDFDAQRLRADTAENELRTERLRADTAAGDANEAEADLLRTSDALLVAEQRISEQIKLIAGLVEYADNLLIDVNNAWQYAGSTGNPETHRDTDYVAAVAMLAALKPKPEAGSHER